MKLATFTHAGSTRIGVVRNEELVDLASAAPELPRDLIGFLALGPRARQRAGEVAVASTARIPLGEVHLEAPVPRPPKYLAIGLNYADHVAESGLERPKFPPCSTSSRPAWSARKTRSTCRGCRVRSTTRANSPS